MTFKDLITNSLVGWLGNEWCHWSIAAISTIAISIVTYKAGTKEIQPGEDVSPEDPYYDLIDL